MAHRIERVPATSFSAEPTIGATARKMQGDHIGDTADVVWGQDRIAELRIIRTRSGPAIICRRTWPSEGTWQLTGNSHLTQMQKEYARQDLEAWKESQP